MTPVFGGAAFLFLKKLNLAYKYLTKSKHINKTETEGNDVRYGSCLVTFYIKKMAFCTQCSSLID